MTASTTPAFADLLAKAVTEPGILSSAYSQFHDYSLGNILLAAVQCSARGIPLGPMATYPRWKELGRHVRKGEKALTLCQPVTIKRKGDSTESDDEADVFLRFVHRNSWFVLAQTDGADVPPADPPGWDKAQALAALDVAEISFNCVDGNILGFARGRQISISPINPLPSKTLFHELAHVLLGHTADTEQTETEVIARDLREAEAESAALLCCEALGLPGAEYCRGYIQHWLGEGQPIPERSAQRVFRVADQIIRAGKVDTAAADAGDSADSNGGADSAGVLS